MLGSFKTQQHEERASSFGSGPAYRGVDRELCQTDSLRMSVQIAALGLLNGRSASVSATRAIQSKMLSTGILYNHAQRYFISGVGTPGKSCSKDVSSMVISCCRCVGIISERLALS